jgi:hypothetical protein
MQFVTETNVSPSGTTGWQTVSLSAHIPSGAAGVVLRLINVDATNSRDFGWRKTGSASELVGQVGLAQTTSAFVGVDASRQCDFYKDHANAQYWLLGYFTSNEAVFFDEPEQDFPLSGFTYKTASVPGVVGNDVPSAVFLSFKGGWAQARHPDDTNSFGGGTSGISGWIAPVDNAEQFEYATESSAQSVIIHGYLKAGASQWDSSASDYAALSSGSYYAQYPQTQPSGSWAIAGHVRVQAGEAFAYRSPGDSGDVSYVISNDNSTANMFFVCRIIDSYIEIKYTTTANTWLSELGFIRIGDPPTTTLQGVERGKSIARGFARGMR